MKPILSFIVFFLYLDAAYSQQIHWNNDSIEYELMYKTPSVLVSTKKKDNKSSPKKNNKNLRGYFIRIEMSAEIRNELLCKDFSFWFEKLNEEKTDLATNLILYNIYMREATLIKVIELDKSKWNSLRGQEIEYWKSFFESKIPPNGCK